ncbi:MAG: aryl-sulfate sulfotransferase [candidate division WOR-3 bacterium]
MLFKNYLLKFAPALILGLTSLPTNASAEVFDGLIISNPVFSRTASLIDTNRQVVHSWNFATTPAYVVYLMPDSSIWRPDVYSGAVMRGGVYGGLIQHYDWYGNIIKSFVWSDSNHQQHHDIHPMPNGHILLLSWDRKTQTEAQAMGRVNINGDMWAEEIIEYDPETDSVVWEWHVWDHMIQDVDPSKPNYGVVREHPELIDINLGTLFMYGDWIHANIIDYNEERDEIVFCSHFLNELYVIDHSTTTEEAKGHTGGRHGKGGDIIYRWGNPQNYDRGDSTDQRFFVVHGANWIRPGLPGAGNILVFNNGDRPGNNNDYSEVIEITPPLDSNDHYYIHPDSAFGPAAPTWIYSNPGTFYSGHMSGAYRLPNGNTFITEAVSGRLFEVTYEGQVVWECPTSSWNGRALKYPRNYLSSINQELTAQPPNLRLIYKRINRSGEPVTIGFNLPIRGKVSLLIYDALGRKIASLPLAMTEKGEYPAGEHQFQVSLPERQNLTGVYFLQLIVNNPKQSNRPVMGKIIMTK